MVKLENLKSTITVLNIRRPGKLPEGIYIPGNDVSFEVFDESDLKYIMGFAKYVDKLIRVVPIADKVEEVGKKVFDTISDPIVSLIREDMEQTENTETEDNTPENA